MLLQGSFPRVGIFQRDVLDLALLVEKWFNTSLSSQLLVQLHNLGPVIPVIRDKDLERVLLQFFTEEEIAAGVLAYCRDRDILYASLKGLLKSLDEVLEDSTYHFNSLPAQVFIGLLSPLHLPEPSRWLRTPFASVPARVQFPDTTERQSDLCRESPRKYR